MSLPPIDDPAEIFVQAFRARFPGAEVVPPDAPRGISTGPYSIGFPYFSAFAPDMRARGWSIFPQRRDERRGPSSVDGSPIRWKAYTDQIPSADEVAWWARQCPTDNSAAIMGPASGNAFALDVDVSDEALSLAIVATADRILGRTSLRRVGSFPRIVLLYQQAPVASRARDEAIVNRVHRFAEGGHAIEVLAHGKPVTFQGMHWKTGRVFEWVEAQPWRVGPEAAPLVTRAKLDDLFDAVAAIAPFAHRSHEVADVAWAYDDGAGLHRPLSVPAKGLVIEDDLVVDGREAYLFGIVRETVRANEGAARAPEGFGKLCALVEDQFRAGASLDGWHDGLIRSEIEQKVRSQIDHCISRGGFLRSIRRGLAQSVEQDGTVAYAPSVVDDDTYVPPEAEELAHLKHRVGRTAVKRRLLAGADPVRAMARDIIHDEDLRLAAARRAVQTVQGWEAQWLEEIHARARLPKGRREAGEVQILKGSAGVGKTSGFWRALRKHVDKHGRIGMPIGFAMPTHGNIADSLSFATGEEIGAFEVDVEQAVAQGERLGLRVVVFRGKTRTNCAFKTQIAVLNGASIGTQHLCKAKVMVGTPMPGEKPEYEERRCPMWDACEYQRSLVEILSADVVLFASKYLDVPPPKELSDALAGLVVDERPYGGLIKHNASEPMLLRVLETGRAPPRLLEEELKPLLDRADAKRAIDEAKEGYLAERTAAVEIVMPHLRKADAGAAVQALFRYREGNRRAGLDYARSAYAVVSRGSDAARHVVPGMTEDAAKELADTPTGDGLWAERRFWAIVIDRLEAMVRDEENPGSPRTAMGASDRRLQVVTVAGGGLAVMMSWRAKPSFPKTPLLLLDASAEPRIVEKIWSDRVVRLLPVEAPTHLRAVLVTGGTFSDYSMLPSRHDTRSGMVKAAERIALHRQVITRLAGVHGDGRLLVGGNKGVMAVHRANWLPPENVDFVHNGAMRGLDFAKHHAAAIVFGRLELPPRVLDAVVAALTYDDPDPEQAVDRFGNGRDASGEVLRATRGEKRVALRDGRDVAIEDTVYDGAWAKIVQSQYREEEVRQFAARLRPVHRVGRPPVVYLATAAIPEGLIIDDMIDVADLACPVGTHATTSAWEIARSTGGILDTRFGWTDRPDLRAGWLTQLKLDVPGHPEAQGTVRIRWRIADGPWTVSSVTAWHEDPATPLRAALIREDGYTNEDLDEALKVEVLWRGRERRPSGTRPPDSIDLQLTTLSEGASRDEVRRVYADQEAVAREATMARVTSEISGLPEHAEPEAIQAALKAKRIDTIDWLRRPPFPGVQRKDDTVCLDVLVLLDAYGAAELDTES